MVYVILPCHTYYNSVTCADAWFLYYPSQPLFYYNRSCGMFKYEIYKQLWLYCYFFVWSSSEIFKKGELDENITCAKFTHVGTDQDQTYETKMYILDVIISVGYRVRSII